MKRRPTDRPRRLIWLFILLVVAAVIFNSLGTGGSVSRGSLEAASGFDPVERPMLLIDPAARVMQLRMAGCKVWEIPFEVHPLNLVDGGSFFASLAEKSTDGRCPVAGRHLYEARGAFDKTELTVVGDELSVPPAMLQRTYPGRFALVWPGGYTLEVTTEIEGSPVSRWDNLCFDILRFIDSPISGRLLRIKMNSTDALTLYHVARPGLPVIICF